MLTHIPLQTQADITGNANAVFRTTGSTKAAETGQKQISGTEHAQRRGEELIKTIRVGLQEQRSHIHHKWTPPNRGRN